MPTCTDRARTSIHAALLALRHDSAYDRRVIAFKPTVPRLVRDDDRWLAAVQRESIALLDVHEHDAGSARGNA